MTIKSHNLSGLFADRYMIERALGRGASATVYLAHDNKQDREIALKVLAHELAHALGSKRFLQEIHITSRLQHPHILPIHDSGEWNGLLYYVLPFVAGESLRARLQREKQLPIDECVRLTCDIASALSHAHAKGVIHRDVKPENILLSEGHALIADFGIARTIETITAERLTSSGLIVGTSQYMSPEQASGERDIDVRSDIYSLGCVLYEMLAGVEPFVGPNTQAIIAQRFTHMPRPVTTFRPSVPENLENALVKALSISPADRFQTMKEFAAALPPVAGRPSERRRPGRSMRDMLRSTRGKVIAAASIVITLVAFAAALPRANGLSGLFISSSALDTSLYVVMPLAGANGQGSLAADEATERITQAMQRWGIPIVSDVRIEDALRNSGRPSTPSQAAALARELSAGKMIWGRLDGSGAPGEAGTRIKLYDVRTGNELRHANIAAGDSSAVDRALMDLLRDPARPATADGGDGRTRSYVAWQAYAAGHSALKQWNIQQALRSFQAAAEADPAFVPARLWKAQLMMWVNEADSSEWLREAEFAASRASALAPRDSLAALGLNAISQHKYPAACAEYRKLTQLDSADFLGWYGLGACQSRDNAVTASRESPSGFRFRSSFRQAAADYLRAVKIDPGASIVSYDQILRVLLISPSQLRKGVDADGFLAFVAYPSFDHDTLTFIPFPLSQLPTQTVPSTHSDVLDRNARDLFEFANSWARADPRNPNAFEALASVLEARGEIGARSSNSLSASEAVARGLALPVTEEQRVRLLTTEVRLRIKRNEFASAARLADSALARAVNTRGSKDLLALSAFTGQLHRMAEEGARAPVWISMDGRDAAISPDLIATGANLFARAALGDCSSATSAVNAKLGNQLESYVTPDRRTRVKNRLTLRSNSLLTSCTAGISSLQITNATAKLYRAQQAYARKNFGLVRSLLDSTAISRLHIRPGDVSLDQTFQEAWLKTAIADTLGAVKQLDLALNALPTLSAAALTDPAAAAALARAMALRADLAVAAGDNRTAAQWASAVAQLWVKSDPALAPVLNRMRRLSQLR